MPIYNAADYAKVLGGFKNILNVGPAGNGKTVSLWTLLSYLQDKNLGPLHVFDLDDKIDSLIEACIYFKRPELLELLIVHKIKAPADLKPGAPKVDPRRSHWEDFQRQFNEFNQQIDPKTLRWIDGYKCGAIWFDSLTAYNEMVIQYTISLIGHDLGDKGTDSRNDYGKVMSKVAETIKLSKAFPCIVGWNSHDQIVRSEFDGKIVLIPNVSGKDSLAPTLPQKFNCTLWSTTLKEKDVLKYVWQVHPEGWVRSAFTDKLGLPTFIPQDYRLIL